MNQEIDIKACRRLLSEIGDLCEHASLTGSMSSGAARTAERYNTVLERLVGAGIVDAGMFSAVPATANFDEVGVEAKMLAGYLPGDKNKQRDHDHGDRSMIVRLAPFIGQSELNELVRDHAKMGGLDINLLSSLAPFLGQEYLSGLVRENLLKSAEPSVPVSPAAPPAPQVTPAPSISGGASARHPVPMEANEQGVGHLLDMLQDTSLTEAERQHVIERIRIATG